MVGCVPTSTSTTTAAGGTSSGGSATTQLPVKLDNSLSKCVEIAPEQVESVRNVVVLGARMRMLQSLAACGCKTALLGYRVRLDDPWRSGIVGRFDTNQRSQQTEEHVYLLLSTDAPLLQQAHTASVTVTCTTGDD